MSERPIDTDASSGVDTAADSNASIDTDTDINAGVNTNIDADAGTNPDTNAATAVPESDPATSAERIMHSAATPQTTAGAVGLGVDLVNIERMQKVIGRSPTFTTRVFTVDERAYCDSTAQPHVHYATRFAAKEAVLKALGTGIAQGIAPADVEVVRLSTGAPKVRLHRRAAELAKHKGVRDIPLSLSYTHLDAVACAMVITDDSQRAQAERVDPMEELMQQFKEARTWLDDIPAPISNQTEALAQ